MIYRVCLFMCSGVSVAKMGSGSLQPDSLYRRLKNLVLSSIFDASLSSLMM